MKKINETFQCIKCKEQVSPAKKTCRNHCPFCFTSLHVDEVIPGDRNSACKGIMNPIEYFLTNGVYKIHFECNKCGKKHWNKRADDDDFAQLDLIIKKNKKI